MVNSTLAGLAAQMQSPITFVAITTTALAESEMDKIIALLSEEEVDATTRFLYLDQMTAAARLSMLSMLIAYKAAIA